MISSVYNSIHPPELEVNAAKTAWDGDTRNPLTLRNALVDVQLHIASDPRGVPLGNAASKKERKKKRAVSECTVVSEGCL